MQNNYPSVTQALKIIHSFDLEAMQRARGWRAFDDIMNNAAERGTAFHKITEQIDRGCDIEILLMGVDQGQPHLKKAVKAYYRWFTENVIETFVIEDRLKCDTYKFTGQPDLVCRVKGKKSLVCIEKKFTAKILNNYRYQSAAYSYLAAKHLGQPVANRLILRFQEKGLIQAKYLPNKEKDFNLFICALNLYKNIGV